MSSPLVVLSTTPSNTSLQERQAATLAKQKKATFSQVFEREKARSNEPTAFPPTPEVAMAQRALSPPTQSSQDFPNESAPNDLNTSDTTAAGLTTALVLTQVMLPMTPTQSLPTPLTGNADQALQGQAHIDVATLLPAQTNTDPQTLTAAATPLHVEESTDQAHNPAPLPMSSPAALSSRDKTDKSNVLTTQMTSARAASKHPSPLEAPIANTTQAAHDMQSPVADDSSAIRAAVHLPADTRQNELIGPLSSSIMTAARLGANTDTAFAPGLTPQVAINTPFGASQWGHDLGRQVLTLTQNFDQASRSAELRLDPPELGPLRITLSINDGVASANFVSAHATVRHAVESALPQLQQALAQAGISLGETNVGERHHQAPHSGEQGQQQSGGQETGTNDAAVAELNTQTQSTVLLPLAVAMPRQTRGLVDTFA